MSAAATGQMLLRGTARRMRAAALRPVTERTLVIENELARLRLAIGSLQARDARIAEAWHDAEFQCFSQFGEDGLIQWLLARVPVENEFFVEFGVADYRESNTRFLVEHDNWAGLIIDGGRAHLEYIEASGLKVLHTLDGLQAFVTAENINDLLSALPSDLGLLSVDIDGMDYWVLSAIEVRPRIVICEYNSLFGPLAPVSVPYDAGFQRQAAHFSMLYAGASIAALAHWAQQAGYRLVGSNSAGNNAFFVRDDLAGSIPGLDPREAWVESRFRESRDRSGKLSYTNRAEQAKLIGALPLVDVVSGEMRTLASILSETTAQGGGAN